MEAYLDELVAQAREVLDDNLVGVYVGGSIALDSYRPGASDVDVAIVVGDALTDLAKHALVGRLRHESLPCPARGLELVVYRLEVARSDSSAPGFGMELNTGRDLEFRATYRSEDRPVADGLFWYAVDRSILRGHGRTLVGPPAEEVFGEIDDLRALLVESVRWHIEHMEHAGPEGVLGAHRALLRLRTGRWVSKVEASRIVQEEVLHELTQ